MPNVDGIECVRRLRAWEAQQPSVGGNGARRHTRTVAVSANSDEPGARATCLSVGFDRVEMKPLSQGLLQNLLGAWSGPNSLGSSSDAALQGTSSSTLRPWSPLGAQRPDVAHAGQREPHAVECGGELV